MSISVKWSDQLELLADGLFKTWRSQRSVFRKVCVVVHDMGTRDWLKNYYLMNGNDRRVLMNMDFIPLPEFVNNWLFAKTHDEALDSRKPNEHPYAKPIMTWRIYRILSDKAPLPAELLPLLEYIGNDEKNAPRRRYALAQQIAKLYDDYLNSRFAVLLNWESPDFQPMKGIPSWQPVLYRLLAQEESGTYASDYNSVLFHDIAKKAVDNGFPDYSSVHVFDIPDMPEPTFHLLEKISEEMDVTFWTFNPCGDWLADTPTKKSAIKEMIRLTRNALKNGDFPPSFELDGIFADPQERLLGALGMGGRAIIGAQLDDFSVSPEDVLGTPKTAFTSLGNAEISVHNCFSPRRELEAVRNGLHDFFQKNPEASPRDAIVLCGDWSTYAPIVDAVFSTDENAEGYIPMTFAGSISGDTPLTRSFSDLMSFRDNRFELSAVFALLSIPAIRSHFGLDGQAVQTLRDMAQNANIRWGFDDDDVNAVIGVENGTPHYPYTWRRGLDRLALDMLYGPLENDNTIVEAGDLGELLPSGKVEGDRAQNLKDLNRFIDALAQLRRTLKNGKYDAETWQKLLLDIVNQFYEEDDENLDELKKIRRAIQSVHDNIQMGGMTEDIESDVFVSAVLSSIKNILPGSRTPADSVLFAPLKSASATPHRFVWICGLNDGVFPHIEYHPSFDIIGKHPSLFDVTSRDRDGFALLKAALSTRGHLALSYVGRNIKTSESIPPSVLLNELLEYLKSINVKTIKEYKHPLQSYSPTYFTQGSNLPPNYSATDYAVAMTLNTQQKPSPEEENNISAFTLNETGETIIPAEDLADFFTNPNIFLIKRRLNLNTLFFSELQDEDVQVATLNNHLKSKLMLTPPDDQEKDNLGKVLVEKGNAPDWDSAEIAIDGANDKSDEWRNYPLKFGKSKTDPNKEFTCDNTTVVGAYKEFLEHPTVSDEEAVCDLNGHVIRIPFKYKRIRLQTREGLLDHVFHMDDAAKAYDSTHTWTWILHIIGHAAGCTFATIFFGQKMPANSFRPLDKETAKAKLKKCLEVALAPLPQDYPDFDKANKKDDTPFAESVDKQDDKPPFVPPASINTHK
ncbi:MAG: exodeoxyribonuclease V subunit gamma [Victivallales bacterium]|nr:exodeoxyribonuclease V subunit gamma [Victivallales bacterium]